MTQSDVTELTRATTLVARSIEIDPPADLLEHWTPGGFAFLDADDGFVASGVAATVAPARAATLLASIAHTRDADVPEAAGPRGVGALPFAGGGRLVVPARIVARDSDGRAWCTQIERADAPAPLHIATPSPSSFSVTSPTTPDDWRAMVDRALAAIAGGPLEKVVLARTATITADRPWDLRTVLATLRATQPGCTVYATGTFVGASPEVLVRKRGNDVTARPLAGTGTDPARLLESPKDAHEHTLVVDAVAGAIQARCHNVHVVGPAALTFANVSHLATTVTGETVDAQIDVVDFVNALHPTPAVAGTPRPLALDTIRALEALDRGSYAGPCGWIDAHGDGAFVVTLRGGDVTGATATLYAGAGIVAGSDPDAEWAETQQKLTPMLQALIRP